MIRLYDPALEGACREFLDRSPRANYCHDPAWIDVIREAYGKKSEELVNKNLKAVEESLKNLHQVVVPAGAAKSAPLVPSIAAVSRSQPSSPLA